jgi:signal transduction histidine kinase
MSVNALLLTFGAISNSAIGLAFLLKWFLDGRRRHDLAWAVAIESFAISNVFAGQQYGHGSVPAGVFAIIFFATFVSSMIAANLEVNGRTVGLRTILGLAAGLAAAALLAGLHDNPAGFAVFTTVGAIVFLWTGWTLRDLPQIGTLVLVLFLARAGFLGFRPLIPDGPWRIPVSLAAQLVTFLAGFTLLAGSVLRSRDLLQASDAALRRSNADLVMRDQELSESYERLQEQTRRLEELTADYVTALDRLERANQAKDAFIANMNHELRTPLNAILGFTDLIRQQAPQAVATQAGATLLADYAGYAHEGGQAMLRHVNRILEFVALESGQRALDSEPFDPAALAAMEIAALRDAAAAKRLTITSDTSQAPQAWPCGERGFRTVLDELLRNAVKAAPDDSTVVVRVAGAGTTELTLEVSDAGRGLPRGFLASVGEGFNIGEHVLSRGGEQQGVGLGLGIVARYVKLMGGRLEMVPNQPRGTIARIVVPGGT